MTRSARVPHRWVPAALAACVLAAFVAVPAGRPALAAPAVVGQALLEGSPGTIVAWRDSAYFALAAGPNGEPAIYRVRRATGERESRPIGRRGLGTLLTISPDGQRLLASEPDSAGVNRLLLLDWPKTEWTDLLPVSDADPHVSWYADGGAILYQDILDDPRSTPSVFHYKLGEKLPRLYLFGCQRPLLAPTGDAIVCVGVDTLNPGSMRDLESRQPVGMEDLKTGDFHWVAPLRTYVPDQGGWSPDGNRIALVGYDVDTTAALARRLTVHSRITRANKIVPLTGDVRRPDREHAIDRASWSPDGQWIAVGMVPPRPGELESPGGVWLVTPGGNAAHLLTPPEGIWRGVPIWTGPRQFLVGAEDPSLEGHTTKYWLVEIAGS